MSRRINYNGETKLDLGCGHLKKDGFIGMDYVDHKQELLWDATNGIPLPDNSIEEIYSSHFIEHLKNEDIPIVRDEMYRICKDGAILNIKCPHDDCVEAYWLCHKSLWNERRVRAVFSTGYNDHQQFDVLEVKLDGIEIQFKLKVNKIT